MRSWQMRWALVVACHSTKTKTLADDDDDDLHMYHRLTS